MANKFRIQFDDGATKSASVKIKPPKDIVMFVAGTTDPINIAGEKHQANSKYWKDSLDNFWGGVKKLKPQYLDLHIEDTFFSWSGDNDTSERNKAAERLLDLFLRVYKNWTKKEVHLHLIGHSHGGNVINQFTELIAKDDKFPKHWKIKSITYLSTPFFKKQHQLNHDKLHPKCKIINVHNEYDITQRFVADFTLRNLESLISGFDKKSFDKAIDNIKSTNFDVYKYLKGFVVNNDTEGPQIWTETSSLLEGITEVVNIIIKNVAFIGKRSVVSKEKKEFLELLSELSTWSTAQQLVFERNRQNRNGGYGRGEFIEDLDLLTVLTLLNRIFAIQNGEENSYLLGLLDNVFAEKNVGLIDKIDDTSWSPEKQINGKFEIVDINITEKDDYHSRNKKSNFEKFAKGVEKSIKRDDKNSLREVLMNMISQFITPEQVKDIIDGIWWFEFIVWGASDTQLKLLKTRLKVYETLVRRYNANLIDTKDAENKDLKMKPGSIPYLAMISHGLSHTKLFDDSKHNVKEALISSFSSGKNPGYKG